MIRCARAHGRLGADGFTLLEMLMAVAAMAMIVGALGAVTGQWLPNWKRGLVLVQSNEQLAIALDRLAADLASAEYVAATGLDDNPAFSGTDSEIIFVRAGLGPNQRGGLDIVRVASIVENGERMLVRSRAPFRVLAPGDPALGRIVFRDPVVLMRPPWRLAFAFAAQDGKWQSRWRIAGDLPTWIRLDIRSAPDALVLSTVVRVHAEMVPPRPDMPNEPAAEPERSPQVGGRS